MSSQNKILPNSRESLFNSVEHSKKTGTVFFTVSLFLHILFFCGLIFFQDFSLPKSLPPVIKIDLVSFAPEPVPEEAQSEARSPNDGIPVKKSVIKKKNKKIPTIKPDISLKTKPKNLKELMAKKKEKPKKNKLEKKKLEKIVKKVEPEEKSDPEKVLKEAREQLEEKIEKQNQDRLAQALSRLEKRVEDQGAKQKAETDYSQRGYKPIDLYKMVLGSAIKQNWVFSDVLAQMDQNLEVRILIKILKSGVIRDIIYETRSGNRYLDESAKKAIKKTNPLPPLPAGRHSYDVVVIFTPKGLK